MSTWGSDSFECDDALDWIAEFCVAPTKEQIRNALSRVTEADFFDHLEAAECAVGIAAAEVVAALKRKPNRNLPGEFKECLSRFTIKADSSLISLAFKAVERIKTDSGLKELWDESENPDEWYSALGDLEGRLKELDFAAWFAVTLDEMRAEEARGKTPLVRRNDAPVESAASIEEASIEDLVERLCKLFPKPSEAGVSDRGLASSAVFDEDIYRQFKPLFAALLAHLAKTSK